METNYTNSHNPLDHTSKIKDQFDEIISHLREDISKVEDLQAKALFEVSAEVITGLKKAFSDYEEKMEEAWKK
jgi:NifU-like protein involved in Fe-S cluster formation